VLSAYGMGLADVTAMRQRALEAPLSDDTTLDRVAELVDSLEAETRRELADEGVPEDRIRSEPRALLRYDGTDTTIAVEIASVDDMIEEFEASYRRQFSFLMRDKTVVVEAVSVEVLGKADSRVGSVDSASSVDGTGRRATKERGWLDGAGSADSPPPAVGVAAETSVEPAARVEMFVGGSWTPVDLFRRDSLRAGDRVDGPSIVAEENATTVVELGWRASVNELGHLVLTRVEARTATRAVGTDVDPVMLEIFNNLFMSIAEQMGVRLQSTAHSVNIKERLDFSCALFDVEGNLIANAPHMPVHLGSMGESIKMVINRRGDTIKPGDVYALNDPYHGGTHLPDVTVVTPVFDEAGDEILFYVAARGHHAEIGGLTPGSMPAFSTEIDEEGVLIDNWLLVENGELREAETIELLRTAPYPSRNPASNIADLRAMVAANEKGVEELRAMVGHFGLDVVRAYMGHVRRNAEEAVRRVISALHDGSYTYHLDTGATIEVRVSVDRETRSADIDFTGTSDQQPGNANAPSSVVMAAVLYVFRTLVDDEIPLNSGCLEPIRVTIPPGSMLAPAYPAAVAAGNVETSQAVTGALYAALGVQAEGSGTMNNVTFGNDSYQYYETVASGSGAGDGFDGADVVQTHMTNSRLTDPEVLEWRYPVRVDSYRIRHGSGGAGRWRGGDGGVRRIRFLEPMTVTTLSSHRRVPPYGMAGGETGTLGRHWLEHTDGSTTPMEGSDSKAAVAGDVFVIETPGGGGYGAPD
jgi:5-oxoprolinase (ATP-hydrolysing)